MYINFIYGYMDGAYTIFLKYSNGNSSYVFILICVFLSIKNMHFSFVTSFLEQTENLRTFF
jgi:hypothetical protein